MIAVAAFLAGAAGVALATGAGGAADPERARIEAVVREYILAHPEIIPEAMEKLQAKETATVVEANRTKIETPFASAWAGAAKPDATLVLFYDYACGFCRQSLPVIERLLKEDASLRIVFRELPILSPESETAARTALAAAQAGKFKRFHDALWAAGRPSAATIDGASKTAGLDPRATATAVAAPAIQAEIDTNIALARELGFTGTPSWVIGDQVLNGAVGYDALKAAIAKARAS